MKKKPKPKSKLLRIITSRWFVTAMVCLAGALIAYLRYPNYIALPNFYSEDGTIFAQNIIDKGLLPAMFTPFNGYFITGLYMLEGVAFAINALVGGSILDLPVAFAVVSYLFWGAVCALPLLLFWGNVKHKTWLVLISITLALLPLPSFNYAILGALGNYKFAFLFIAFVLLLKRHWLPANSKWFYVIDAGLILCAFTNMTVVLLLPFAALRYLPKWREFTLAYLRSLLGNKGFVSLGVTALVIAAQVAFLFWLGQLDSTKGYMSEPYEIAKTIEIFIYRTLMFPFTYPIAPFLNNLSALLLFAITLGGVWSIARREDRVIILFGLYAALIATILFVSQRSGVSLFFVNYTTSATDQFFYPQNWIFLFAVLFALARGLSTKAQRYKKIAAIAVLCLVPLSMAIVSLLHFNSSLEREQKGGSFKQNAALQCARTNEPMVKIPIYPIEAQAAMAVDRAEACN